MAQQRLSMRKFKEILRLRHELGLSHRQIAGSCGISHVTVGTSIWNGPGRRVSAGHCPRVWGKPIWSRSWSRRPERFGWPGGRCRISPTSTGNCAATPTIA